MDDRSLHENPLSGLFSPNERRSAWRDLTDRCAYHSAAIKRLL